MLNVQNESNYDVQDVGGGKNNQIGDDNILH